MDLMCDRHENTQVSAEYLSYRISYLIMISRHVPNQFTLLFTTAHSLYSLVGPCRQSFIKGPSTFFC